jgi:hypothetical protein
MDTELLAREREMRDDREGWIFRRRIRIAQPGIVPGWIARSARP